MANEGQHASFPPSGITRIMSCPASWQASKRVPSPPSSSFAQHGTMLHEVFTTIWPAIQDDAVVQSSFSTYKLEKEDQQYVLECADYLKTVLASCGPGATVVLEHKVTLASWGLPEIWGTADVIVADAENGRIIVIDWKFGKGVPVYAEKNYQGLCYLLGAVKYPPIPVYKDFEIHIVQPPINNYSSYNIDQLGLEDVAKELRFTVAAANQPNAEYHANEDKQCRFCNYKDKCKARFAAIQDNADTLFAAFKKVPEISDGDLGIALQALAQVEQAKKSLTNLAMGKILGGKQIPGWKVIYGRSKRKWVDEAKAMKWLISHKAVDKEDVFIKKLISCSQAEKLNRLLKKNESFTGLWEKPEGKPKLAPESNPGADYSVSTAGNAVFKQLLADEAKKEK